MAFLASLRIIWQRQRYRNVKKSEKAEDPVFFNNIGILQEKEIWERFSFHSATNTSRKIA